MVVAGRVLEGEEKSANEVCVAVFGGDGGLSPGTPPGLVRGDLTFGQFSRAEVGDEFGNVENCILACCDQGICIFKTSDIYIYILYAFFGLEL